MTKTKKTSASRVELQEMAEALRHAVSDFVRHVRAQVDEPTSAQSETLVYLDRRGPISVAALAEMRGVKHQSMRLVIAGLEAAGLVSREPDPRDARSQLVTLTASGQSVLESARDARSQWLADILDTKLADSEREILRSAIPVLRKIAGKDAAGE